MPQQIISKLISPWRRTAALRVALLALLSLSATALFVGPAQAASYVANYVGANIRDTWVTVTTDGAVSIDLVRTPTGSLGVGKSNVTVKTNSSTGYRLYVSAADHEDDFARTAPLYKTDDHSKKILPLSNTSSPAAFDPATPNRWGYALANDGTSNTTGFSEGSLYEAAANQGLITSNRSDLTWKGMSGDYHVLVSSDTSSENPGITTPVYYGVYVNSGTPESPELGTYRNVIVYTAFIDGGSSVFMTPSAVWDGDTVSIVTEHQNSGDTPVTADQIEVTLYDSDNASSSIATCDNITVDETRNGSYGNSLEFTCDIHRGADAVDKTPYDLMVRINAEDKGIYITYAADDNWAFTKTLASISTMQEITPEICANTPDYTAPGQLYTLTDSRDGKQYYVSKLKDGACWMVQNLDLDLRINDCTTDNKTTGTTGTMGTCNGDTFVPFTTANTNISGSNWNVSGSNVAYDTQNATGTTWDSYGRAGGNNSYYEVRSHDPGNTCLTNGTTNATCTPAVGAAETRRDGNYYNWPAATAGTGTYQTAANGIASDSICPKGWHLPYGNSGTGSKQGNTKGGWYYLLNSLGTSSDSALLAAPYYLNRSGFYSYSNGSISNRTGNGCYWSSMAISAGSAYRLRFGSSAVYPGTDHYDKGSGFSVRCVANDKYDYIISYDANGGTGAPAATFVQKDAPEDTALTVSNTAPTRDGYDFLGWSTNPSATTADSAYAPGASVTLTTSNSSRKLYAVWKSAVKYMQDFTATECSALPTNGTPIKLTDKRDNKSYMVEKLSDGYCWMVQNLALEGGKTITSADSNVASDYPLPASSTSGFSSDTAQYMYNGTHKDYTADNTSNNTGAYYSWLTATANSGAGMSSGEAIYSICPKGWRLPAQTGTKSLRRVYEAYSSNFANYNDQWRGALAGFYGNSSLLDGGNGGYWWSRTVLNDTSARYVSIYNSGSAGMDSVVKCYGASVRCVFEP